MFKQFAGHCDDMALAVLLWMCILPIVGLLAFPFVGIKIGLLLAGGLLMVIVLLCWGRCSWKLFNP